jgi:hypothetical protein
LGNSDITTPISINLKSGDLLHSWPEFYDPNFGWVAVDPTWGNTSKTDYFTKLDTNHFAFVIKGINSEYPLPAGMYRTDDSTKLIDISFAYESAPLDSEDISSLDQAKNMVQKESTSLITLLAVSGFALVFFFIAFTFIFKKSKPFQSV